MGDKCDEEETDKADRYPYRHHGLPVHGSKMMDYLISELSLREDRPELFEKTTSIEGG